MDLLQTLRDTGEQLLDQVLPNADELPRIVGALIAHLEQNVGDALVQVTVPTEKLKADSPAAEAAAAEAQVPTLETAAPAEPPFPAEPAAPVEPAAPAAPAEGWVAEPAPLAEAAPAPAPAGESAEQRLTRENQELKAQLASLAATAETSHAPEVTA